MLRATAIGRLLSLVALTVLAACQATPPTGGGETFDEAMQKWNAQSQGNEVLAYLKVWNDFNNENHLDERGGCYTKNGGSVQLILLIDEGGKVRNVAADISNEKAKCFQEAYMDVRFPPPPFPNFRRRLKMR